MKNGREHIILAKGGKVDKGRKDVVHDDTDDVVEKKTEPNEAYEFADRNRDIFEQMARGRIHIEPAPPGVDTFAFDLNTNTIYIHPRFYRELDLSEVKTTFATLHEIQHFLEKLAVLAEDDGALKFEQYLKRIKSSRAYSLMDNCVADVRENKAVVRDTNEDIGEVEVLCYKEDLFPELDLTSEPKHVQFCDALLREARVPDEKCALDPEVRIKLEALRELKDDDGTPLLSIFTDPDVPMSLRHLFQNEQVWPVVKELLDKDIEEKNKEDKKTGKGKGKGKSGKSGEPKSADPDKMFADAYARSDKRHPHAISTDDTDKAFKEWQKEHSESPLDKALREHAEKIGVSKEALLRYRELAQSLENIIDPDTGESIKDDLRELLSRIISSRLKKVHEPRYPVEEGEELIDHAGAVAQTKAGHPEPRVFERIEIVERKGEKAGEVEITLVFDRTVSMKEGTKSTEQRRAGVLAMEVLKDFGEDCEERKSDMEYPLLTSTEIYSFQNSVDDDKKPRKEMSPELSEKARVEVSELLRTTPGRHTTDYTTLKAIREGLDEDTLEKIKEGLLKKIVIIFTDGESGNEPKLLEEIKLLREAGVVVAGIGITEDGKSAVRVYAPHGTLAKKAENLSPALASVLKEHLRDL
ncbi:MAG: hypothetical protein COV07_01445 [Candidatus Vogelbacteria bacterium CG10_big_fil_rev_8_21_14_0_10_45_14]|uniref:VWFA domain-containing protein n=1 Tax=Candidatus Vogelbacteria bacterium CG10_big_fil_rev_8_21_14_0_10_45_14 TaxID=1975042 RepID=A0A2H0RKA1_9BACT|nr:MAG: hypothetical protein COV07_01445 [Candidatus Vogelbacteria bacterium CG10_big_fil_rev_8_21_14_0_10_45_14]